MEPYQRLLTPTEAALLLGLSKQQLLRSPVRRFRLGHRTVRFDADDLFAYLHQAATAG